MRADTTRKSLRQGRPNIKLFRIIRLRSLPAFLGNIPSASDIGYYLSFEL